METLVLTLPVAELLERLGSAQSAAAPHRATELRGPHGNDAATGALWALLRTELLASEPKVKKDGTFSLTVWRDDLEGEEQLLYWQAINFDVTPGVARAFATDPKERPVLEEVLAAVTLGLFEEPHGGVGAPVAGIMMKLRRTGTPVDDSGQRFGVRRPGTERERVAARPHVARLAACASQRELARQALRRRYGAVRGAGNQ
jgi:hypothetical protein